MLTRREFLKLCTTASLSLGLSNTLISEIAQAFAQNLIPKPPLIWLELGTCTGESISLDNAVSPDVRVLFQEIVDLKYHWLLMQAQGERAVQAVFETIENHPNEYILVVEGSVITKDQGRYNMVFEYNNKMYTGIDALRLIAEKAKHVIAVGDCAAYGGPTAAFPNPAGAVGVWQVIDRKVINVPGCPSNADWMTGTIAHVVMYGEPELDDYNQPKMFFGQTIHDLCHRRSDFETGKFASYPGEPGCLFKVGCKGPVTFADCPVRQWNNHINWPVETGAPCIGCANPGFPDATMPFFQHLPNIQTSLKPINPLTVGKIAGAITALGIGSHLTFNVLTGRLGKHWLQGTVDTDETSQEKVKQEEIIMHKLDQVLHKQETLIDHNLCKKEGLINKMNKLVPRGRKKI